MDANVTVTIGEGEVARLFRQHGMLIAQNAAAELRGRSSAEILEIIEKVRERMKGETTVVTEIEIRSVTAADVKVPDFVEIKRPTDFKPTAKEYGHEFHIETEYDVTGKSKCSGQLDDFVKNINDKFQRLKEILISRPSPGRIMSIDALGKMRQGDKVRLICMVSRKGVTKKGHISIDVEDETERTFLLALCEKRNAEVAEKAKRLLEDDVVAIDVEVGQNYHFVRDITWPDMLVKNKRTTEKDISIAFISDMHIGSKLFLDKEFEAMIKWLNGAGDGNGGEIAEKIGYLLVAGDVIDGIGIYPKQEKELLVKDVTEQYKIASEMLAMVPEHIQVIVTPGNHDAVRRAQPQPSLRDFMKETPNIHLAGNPAYVNIEGLRVLMNHGDSLDVIIPAIPGLSFAKPEEAAVELLKRRDLAVLYDQNDIAPEHRDYLFVEDIDIFQTGHLHKNGYTEYRGCAVLNSGTWQARTENQVRLGHVPTPCILPVYNLKTGGISQINFSHGEGV